MQGYDHVLTVQHMLAHVLNLACVYMRHGMLYGYRKVDDAFVLRGRLPYIDDCVAHCESIFRLGSGEALRAVLKLEVSFCLLSQLF